MLQSYRCMLSSLFIGIFLTFALTSSSVAQPNNLEILGEQPREVQAVYARKRVPRASRTQQSTGVWQAAAPESAEADDSAEAETGPAIESNMIAFWHIREGSQQRNNDGTWRVEIEVRVPTSYQYKFDMDYLVSQKRVRINSGGDDYFSLTASGMQCTAGVFAALSATHNNLLMETRNEFSYSDGAIFMQFNC